MEEICILSAVCCHLKTDTRRACRVTAKHDVVRVAAEERDILMDPFKRLALVAKPVIRGDLVPVGDESVRPDAVVERYNDDIISASLNQAFSVVVRVAE